jgi:hypothetical protein
MNEEGSKNSGSELKGKACQKISPARTESKGFQL